MTKLQAKRKEILLCGKYLEICKEIISEHPSGNIECGWREIHGSDNLGYIRYCEGLVSLSKCI